MNLYLTKMTRWGNSSGHTYIAGIYLDPIVAEIEGVYHGKVYRGKYECEIIKYQWAFDEDVVYLLENSKGEDGDNFFFDIYKSEDSRLTFSIKELLTLSFYRMEIIKDFQVDNDVENYEFLLNCSGLLSQKALDLLKDKLTTYHYNKERV